MIWDIETRNETENVCSLTCTNSNDVILF